MSHPSFRSLDALASSLPFHLDDVDSANAAYMRWHRTQDAEERRVILVWTYCFIRRYFLVKFVQETSYSAADLDDLIDRTFRKVERAESQIKQPSRYASWLSVVCKNTFRNYLRRRKSTVSLQEEQAPTLVGEEPKSYSDVGYAHLALHRAIDRLPSYLRVCMRLRFIEGLSYPEIAERTDHPLPRIRAYIYKGIRRLRDDEDLLSYFE